MKITITALLVIFSVSCLHAQTPPRGKIITGPTEAATPATRVIGNPLDPNGDGYISFKVFDFNNGNTTNPVVIPIPGTQYPLNFSPIGAPVAGFSNFDVTKEYSQEFELKMFGIPFSSFAEAEDDLIQGGSCTKTDFIPDVKGYSAYVGFNSKTYATDNSLIQDTKSYLSFRMRVGDNNPGLFAWHILVDTDGKFGTNDTNPSFTNNKGFELDITLVQGGGQTGIYVYDVDFDGSAGGQAANNPLLIIPLLNNFQISQGDLFSCSTTIPDKIFDFFLDYQDSNPANSQTLLRVMQSASIPGSDGTKWRFVAASSTNPGSIFDSNKFSASDIAGIDNNVFTDLLASISVAVAEQCPISVENDLLSTGEGFDGGFPQKPTINLPVLAGQNLLSGTSEFNPPTTVDVEIKRGSTIIAQVLTLPVNSTVSTSQFGDWSWNPITFNQSATPPSLQGGDIITIKAKFVPTGGSTTACDSQSTGTASSIDVPVNNSPTDITLSNNSISENQPINSAIGTFSSVDTDAGSSFTYALVPGTGSVDNSSFIISGNSLLSAATFNFEAKNSYSIRIRTTDQQLGTFEKVFTVTVTDVNEAPTEVSITPSTIAENAGSNSTVGTLSTADPDAGNTFTYTLVAGTGSDDNGSFTISGNSLLANSGFNFESKNSYSVRVRTTDQGSLFFEKNLTITVTDVNETPTAILLSNTTIAENAGLNATVGSFSTTDPDTNNSFTYTLVSGDINSFDIDGSTLRAKSGFDFETRNPNGYKVRVRSTDQGSLFVEQEFTVTVTDVNEGPTDLSLSNASISENSGVNATIGTFSSTDPDGGDTFTYSLVGGTGSTDNGSFTIEAGVLKANEDFNFESKSSYSIRVSTTDSGSLSFEKVFPITVTNANDAPTDISLSATTLPENSGPNFVIGTLTSTDPDPNNSFTYTLVTDLSIPDNQFFNIDGSSLRATTSLNFETKQNYTIRIRTTDQGNLSYEESFTISVTDVNENPTDINLSGNSIAENAGSNATIGSFTSVDPDAANTFTYSLVSGSGDTDNGLFNIIPQGSTLRATANLDYETKTNYSVRIRTTDQGGLAFEKVFTISVSNVNEIPFDITLDNSTLQENAGNDAAVGVLSSSDPDAGATFTYSLVGGTGDSDNNSFKISGSTLQAISSLNFEFKSNYSVRIRTSDQDGLFYEEVFPITVTNQNETPTNLLLSNSNINENAASNSTVGTLSTSDPDVGNTFTYTLVTGTGADDNNNFSITGDLLIANSGFNFEAKNSYTVRVRTTDQGALFFEKEFIIRVNDVNEAPTALALTNTSIAENAAPNFSIGTLSSTDPDAGNTFTYSLVSGTGDTGNTSFNISGNILRASNSLDFETQSSYSVRIRTADQGGLNFEQTFTITVTNVNESPTDIGLSGTSIAENSAANSQIGTLSSTDPDAGNTFTYTLVSGDGASDNSAFNISGSSLRATAGFDFETKSSFSIRIRTTDQGGNTFEKVFAITVTNVNEGPTDIALSSLSIAENAGVNATIGTFTSTDVDAGESFTYDLVSGVGGADNSSFNIDGTTLRANASFNFEVKNSYSIGIKTTDRGGLTVEKQFTITVTNVNEGPVITSAGTASFAENASGTVYTAAASDPDAGANISFTISGNDASLFNINSSSGIVTFKNAPNFELPLDQNTDNDYEISIIASDGVLTDTKTVIISVTNVNEAPAASPLSIAYTIDTPLNFTFQSSDPDNSTLTYTYTVSDPALSNSISPSSPFTGNLNASGTFTPPNGYRDNFSVNFTVSDGSLTSSATIIFIQDNGLPDPPQISIVVGSDRDPNPVQVDEDQSVTIRLESNDIDNGDTQTLRLSEEPLHGKITCVGCSPPPVKSSILVSGGTFITRDIIYTPNSNYFGSDSFEVTSTDAGGGSANATPKTTTRTINIQVRSVNDAPTITSSTSPSVNENSTGVAYTVTATDVDSGTIFRYSLSGTDATLFTINSATGAITFVNSPDFEAPADANSDNQYILQITAFDGLSINPNTLSDAKNIILSVSDVNEAPTAVILSNQINSINENSNTSTRTKVADITITDDALGTEVISLSGADAGIFELDGNALFLKANTVLNFEAKSTFSLSVNVDDINVGSTPDVTTNFTLSVIDLNESPVVTSGSSLSIVENVTGILYTITSDDPDSGTTITYSISGSDAALFNVNPSTGDVSFINSPDFENPLDLGADNIYTISVNASDGNLTGTKTLNITVTNQNEVPVFTSALAVTYNENLSIDAYTSIVDDPDAGTTLSYALAGLDAGLFTINQGTGSISFNVSPDFENPGDNGFDNVHNLTVTVSDGALSASQNITITVVNVNESPTAISLNPQTIAENNLVGAIVGALTTVDPDNGNTFTYSLVGGQGSDDNLSFNVDGSNIKASNSFNFEFKNSFSIRVRSTDQNGLFFEKPFIVSVTNNNEAPSNILLSSTTIAENNLAGALIGALTTEDVDAGNTFTYSFVAGSGSADNSSFILEGTNLKASTAFDFETKSNFTVRIRTTDQGGLFFEKVFTLNITDVNDAPVASDQTISTNEDVSASILLVAADQEGSTLSYTIINQPANGTLSCLNCSNPVYLPNPDYFGTDSFTFRVSDGQLNSNIATISINVNVVNDSPVALNQTLTLSEDTPKTIVLTATDSDSNALTYSIVTAPANGSISGTLPNAIYTPSFNFSGSDSFSFKANDGSSFSNTATVSLTIEAVNDIPVAVNDAVTTLEDTPVTFSLTVNDSDVDGVVVNSSIDLDPLTPGLQTIFELTGQGTFLADVNGSVTFTPVLNFNGTVNQVAYTIADDLGARSTAANIQVTVISVNDAPVANSLTVVVVEDEQKTFSIPFSDPDNVLGTLSFSVVTAPSAGTVSISGGSFVYNPNSNFNGTDTFTYTVNDGTATSTATITLTVTPVNDAPVANALSITTNEDVAAVFNVNYSDVDNDAAALILSIVENPTNGFLAINGATFTYTPKLNYNGSDAFTYSVSDGNISTSAVVDITVLPVNDAPVVEDLSVTMLEDTQVDIVLKGSDPESEPITFIIIRNPTKGTVTLSGSTVRYTPALNFSGADNFSYYSTDGTNNSAQALVSINVTPVNDAPQLQQIPVTTIDEDQSGTVCIGVLDPDGDTVTFSSPENVSGGGTLVVNQTLGFCFDFTPTKNFSGDAFWKIIACDSKGQCSERLIQFIVIGVNDPPIPSDDELTVRSFEQSEILNLLANDTDFEGDALSVSVNLISAPVHGVFSISPGGAFQYQSELGYIGSDVLVYEVCDTGSPQACATATVNINVIPPKFRVYEGVSPNGDNINDYWRLDGIEDHPDNRVQIFDRYNNMVFDMRGYNNEGNSWRGQANSGIISGNLPDGTYFYIIDLKDGNAPSSGFVVLKRN